MFASQVCGHEFDPSITQSGAGNDTCLSKALTIEKERGGGLCDAVWLSRHRHCNDENTGLLWAWSRKGLSSVNHGLPEPCLSSPNLATRGNFGSCSHCLQLCARGVQRAPMGSSKPTVRQTDWQAGRQAGSASHTKPKGHECKTGLWTWEKAEVGGTQKRNGLGIARVHCTHL